MKFGFSELEWNPVGWKKSRNIQIPEKIFITKYFLSSTTKAHYNRL